MCMCSVISTGNDVYDYHRYPLLDVCDIITGEPDDGSNSFSQTRDVENTY